MKNLIRRWLFPNWTPQPEKGWILLSKSTTLSQFEQVDASEFLSPKGDEETRYKIILIFKNVDTGAIHIEERVSDIDNIHEPKTIL